MALNHSKHSLTPGYMVKTYFGCLLSIHNDHDILNATNYFNAKAKLVNFLSDKYLHDTILDADGIAVEVHVLKPSLPCLTWKRLLVQVQL